MGQLPPGAAGEGRQTASPEIVCVEWTPNFSMIKFNVWARNSHSQQTCAVLVANFFRHYFFRCKAFYVQTPCVPSIHQKMGGALRSVCPRAPRTLVTPLLQLRTIQRNWLITLLYCKCTAESCNERVFENRLRFHRIMAMSLVCSFFAHLNLDHIHHKRDAV